MIVHCHYRYRVYATDAVRPPRLGCLTAACDRTVNS
jgi:hypothetical protein